jgi:pimeloyl-ACP methyl ester carboxylesterase
MPTILAFPDLLEDPLTLRPLFNKHLLEYRNVWLLSYRNSFNSDHSQSMDAEDLASDVIRFMDKNRITTASLLGAGLGGKIATITGILKYHRITSVVNLDYSPMDLRNHEAFKQLKSAIEATAKIPLTNRAEVEGLIRKVSPDVKLQRLVLKNLAEDEKKKLYWRSGFDELAGSLNNKDERLNFGAFATVGLFPGRNLSLYAERSPWVHMSSNTIPMYKIFPVLYGEYGQFLDHYDTDNHNLHETEHVSSIAKRIFNFYRWFDGVHLLLNHRDEIGRVSVPIRHRSDVPNEHQHLIDEIGDPNIPKMVPVHRHHNWGYGGKNTIP